MKGFVPYLLVHLNEIAKGAAPSEKFTPMGMLDMLMRTSPDSNVVNIGHSNGDGTYRDVKVKTKTRGDINNVGEEDNCDIDVIPEYVEYDVSMDYFRKITIGIEDSTIEKYEAEATRIIDLGAIRQNPSLSPLSGLAVPGFMAEFVNDLVRQCYPLFQSINQALVAKQALNFGVNNRTGNALATVINLASDTTVRNLNNGFLRVVQDYQENEQVGKMQIVGNGFLHGYVLEMAQIKGVDSTGKNETAYSNYFDFYYDPATVAGFGANQCGVFAPGSVALINHNKFLGFKSGDKMTSYDFVLTLPIVDSLGGSNSLSMLKLDAQLQRIDCPTEVTYGYAGGTKTMDRGWKLTLSKSFDLHNIPDNAYLSNDRNYGVNGTFIYKFTNS